MSKTKDEKRREISADRNRCYAKTFRDRAAEYLRLAELTEDSVVSSELERLSRVNIAGAKRWESYAFEDQYRNLYEEITND